MADSNQSEPGNIAHILQAIAFALLRQYPRQDSNVRPLLRRLSDPFAGVHSRPRDANAWTRNMPPHLRFQATEVHCSPNPPIGVRAMSS
jgi:hypothetical protein